jgi:hypothetical protein
MLFGFHAKTKNRTNECRRKGMEETEKREREGECVCVRDGERERREKKRTSKKRGNIQ